MSARKEMTIAAVLGAAAIAIRVAVLLNYESSLDGDEALVAIMGTRTLATGEIPIFWPGRPYNGTAALNACAAAALFAAFGASPIVYKLVGFAMGATVLTVSYFFVRVHFGRVTSLHTLFLLAFAPAMFVKWCVKPYLGLSAILYNVLILALTFEVAFRTDETSKARRALLSAALGFVAGVALYSSPFAIPMLITSVIVTLTALRRTFFTRLPLPVLPAFLLGASPLLINEVTHGFPWLRFLLFEQTSTRSIVEAGVSFAPKFVLFFGHTQRYFGAPPLSVPTTVWCVVFCIAFVAVAAKSLRTFSTCRRMLSLQLFVILHVAMAVVSPQDVQYLLPLYPFVCVIIVSAIHRRARLACLVVLAVLAVAGYGPLLSRERYGFDKYVYGDTVTEKLLATLKERNATRVYSTYALANHLVLKSGGEIIASSFDVPFPDMRETVDGTPNSVYVFHAGSDCDHRLRAHLRKREIRFSRAIVEGKAVYADLSVPIRPEHVSWGLGYGSPFPWDMELCRSVLRLNPTDAPARLKLAAFLAQEGRTKAARKEIDTVLRWHPQNPVAKMLRRSL